MRGGHATLFVPAKEPDVERNGRPDGHFPCFFSKRPGTTGEGLAPPRLVHHSHGDLGTGRTGSNVLRFCRAFHQSHSDCAGGTRVDSTTADPMAQPPGRDARSYPTGPLPSAKSSDRACRRTGDARALWRRPNRNRGPTRRRDCTGQHRCPQVAQPPPGLVRSADHSLTHQSRL